MNSMIKNDQAIEGLLITDNDSHAIKLAAAVLDKRIMTARQFPRSIARFKAEAIALLQQDIETARAAEYSKPVGDGHVRGPSIRLAEVAVMCWTNIEVEIAEPIVSDRSVTVQAFAWDLERNIRVPGISTTTILRKDGRTRFPQHMIETTILATASKARRNAICAVIPRAYINDLMEAARIVADKHQKPLEQVRVDMIETFAKVYKVSAAQVFKHLGVEGVDDIKAEHIHELRGVFNALKEGEPIDTFFEAEKTAIELAKEKVAARSARSAKNQPLPTNAATEQATVPLAAKPVPDGAAEPMVDFWQKMAAITDGHGLRAYSDALAGNPVLGAAEKQLLWDEITRRVGG